MPKEKKDHGVAIAGRITTPNYELLTELCYYRGETRSEYIGKVLNRHFENVKGERIKLNKGE